MSGALCPGASLAARLGIVATMKIFTLLIALLAVAIPASLLLLTPPAGLIAERDGAAPARASAPQELASR